MAHDRAGRVIAESDVLSIPPGTRFLSSVSDIFGPGDGAVTDWLMIEHSGTLSGFGLIGNDSQLSAISLESSSRRRLILPYVLSGEGIFTRICLLNPEPPMSA